MGPQTPPKNSHVGGGQKPVILTLAIIHVKLVEIFRIVNIFEIINFVRIIRFVKVATAAESVPSILTTPDHKVALVMVVVSKI